MNTRFIVYSFFMAALFISVWGYQFNTGDHAEHLPQVYRHLDPSLYKNDFFLHYYTQTFTVRFFYEWTLYFLSFIAPVAVICFLLTLLCLTATVYAWMQMAKLFSNEVAAPYLAPLFIFFICYGFTVGGNNITYPSITCSVIAKTFISLALWKFVDKMYYKAALLLAIGSLYQAMASGQVFAILGLILLLDFKRLGIKRILLFGIIYLSVASFMLVPLFSRQFLNPDANKELYENIMYKLIVPKHFLPSAFPITDYLKFLLLLLTGMLVYPKLNTEDNRRFIYRFFIIQIIGACLYIMAIECFNIYGMARLQWFKTTIWITAFNAMLISILLAEKIAFFSKIVGTYLKNYFYVIAAVLLLICILNSRYLPTDKLKHRYIVGNYQKTDLTLMHEWIMKHTAKDAVFVPLPDDMSFSCEARRAMAVSTRAMVHEPFFIIPWYSKFREIYGVGLSDTDKRPFIIRAAENYSLHFKDYGSFNVNYRIDDLSRSAVKNKLGKIIHKEGNYVLTAVSEE